MAANNSNEQTVISNSQQPDSKIGGRIKKLCKNLAKLTTGDHKNRDLGDNGGDGGRDRGVDRDGGRDRGVDPKTDFKNRGGYSYPYSKRDEM